MDNVIKAAFGTKAHVVSALEDLLEQARAGEIVGIALVAHTNGNAFISGWSGECETCATVGAIEILKQDFMRQRVET